MSEAPRTPPAAVSAASDRAPDPSSARTQRATLIGAAVNIALAIAKLLAGIVGHSHALIADALESLTDIAGSLIVWSGLRIGAIPPDDDHPYGHGKAEALGGLIVSVMLFGAGVWIAVESVHQIRSPHNAPAPFTLIVLVAVVLVKESLFRFARRVARETDSGAIVVDAWHHRADAITSVAAFIGISVAIAGRKWFPHIDVRWEAADDYAALFASAIILYNAYNLLKIPLRELMDAAAPEDRQKAIDPAIAIALAVPGVRRIEKTLSRKSGTGYYLDMHVQVDPSMNIREAHIVGGKVRAAIRAQLTNVRDVLIHIEPYEDERATNTGSESL